MNTFLQQQIQKHFGASENIPEEMASLFEDISHSYDQHEKEKIADTADTLSKETTGSTILSSDLQSLFENIQEALFAVEIKFTGKKPVFRTLHMSPACLTVYGYDSKSFMDNPTLLRDITIEDDRHILDHHFPILLRGEAIAHDYRIRHKDGSTRWISTKVTPTLDQAGILIRIDGVTNDINEKKLAEKKLEEAHNELNRILENISEVVFSLNMVTGKYAYISAACSIVYGYPVSEFIKNPMLWKDVIHPEDTHIIDTDNEPLYEGKILPKQFRIIHSDKSIRWLAARVKPTLDEKGKLLMLDIFVNDITATKQAQQKLEIANNDFNKLFHNLNEVFYSVDMVSFRLIQMSEACEKVYGYVSNEFLTQPGLWQEVIHPDDKHISHNQVQTLKKGQQVFNQYRIIHKDGSIHWIENKIIPTLDETGRLIRIDGLTNDITSKRNNAQKLQESEMRFRTLIENSADMLTLIGEDRKIFYESHSVAKTLGYLPEENLGNFGYALVHPEDQKNVEEIFGYILRNKDVPVAITYRVKKKDGDYICIEGHVTNMLHIQGINAIACNYRDVTKRIEAEESLAESQSRYRMVYENPFLGIAIGSIDGVLQNVNDAFCKMLGYTRQELKSNHFSKFTLPEDAEKELPFILRMANGELDTYQLEKRYVTKSKKIIWVELSVSAVKDAAGKDSFVVAVVQDITPKKTAEESLRKSEANLKNILENTDTAYVLLDEQAHIISFNRLAEEFALKEMKMPLEEGKDYAGITLSENRDAIKAVITNILQTKVPYRYELKYTSPDDTDKWVSVSMHPISDHTGKVLGVSVATTDITKRKYTEQLIKLSNERHELVTKATNDVIWDWDIKNNKLYRSENYKQVFGYADSGDNAYIQSESNLAQGGYDFIRSEANHIHPEDGERIFNSITQKIEDSNAILWEDEYRYYRHNGELAYVQDRGYIIYNENKKPVRMVGAMRDITAGKIFEIERDKITADLIRQNKNLEQFAYIVSHNLRAPLANISGLLRIIQAPRLEAKIRKMTMDGLVTSVQKLDDVINDLTNILQVKRGINEKREVLYFSSLLEDIKISVEHFIEKENVSFKMDFSAPSIYSVKSYMHSIFYNLISNSIKYKAAGRDPVIEINSRETESKIILTFKDNGSGIDLSLYGDKIFGLYKRFHYDVEGRGMGLFMVKTQVESLEGNITVTSELNKGTTFTIEFEKKSIAVPVLTEFTQNLTSV
ncbi:MAG: PAS domain-containing protein [Bacteroidia bacterium]